MAHRDTICQRNASTSPQNPSATIESGISFDDTDKFAQPPAPSINRCKAGQWLDAAVQPERGSITQGGLAEMSLDDLHRTQ